MQQIARLYELVSPDAEPGSADVTRSWGSTDMLRGCYNTELAQHASRVLPVGLLLVLLYVLFFYHRTAHTFGQERCVALGLDLDTIQISLSLTLNHINSAMRTYLGVKTVTSMITALLELGHLRLR